MTFDWIWSEQTQELNEKQCRTAGSQWQNALQKELGWEITQSQIVSTGEMCCQEGGEISNIPGRKLEDMIMNMKVQKKIKA